MTDDYDPQILKLFDGYVHGKLTRRQFLDRAAGFATAGLSAAAILAALSPDYALANQVDPDDPSIDVSYKRYGSPQGAGVMQGYYARPAVISHRLPGVVVIHENRGLNPYIEDVTRRLAVAGFIAFAPDALHRSAVIVVAGISAQRIQRIRREADEARDGQPPGDVLDVGIEPAVLVNHEDGGQTMRDHLGPRVVALHDASALRRAVALVAHVDRRIVRVDLISQRVVGAQRREYRRRG